jgi:hypothetical protein
VIINTDTYPNIMEAIHLIQMDSGDHLAIPVLNVPERWKYALPEIEDILETLSHKERAPEEEPLPPHVKPSELLDSEFYSFCNGDGLVQVRIANRNMALLRAHVFLSDYFEGWTYTGGDESEPESLIHQKRLEWLNNVEEVLGLTPEQEQERLSVRLKIT